MSWKHDCASCRSSRLRDSASSCRSSQTEMDFKHDSASSSSCINSQTEMVFKQDSVVPDLEWSKSPKVTHWNFFFHFGLHVEKP